jgi:hypothetical protein
MRDSTVAGNIPAKGTDLGAGYVNGRFAWSAADFSRFPIHATIDVLGIAPHADVLDVEIGDATVPTAVVWAHAHNNLKPEYPAIIYCNRSTLTPLFNAMLASGFRIGRDFRLWVATLDGTKKLPDMTGVTAVQYAGQAQTHAHYDESIVYDNNWHAPALPSSGPFRHEFDGKTSWSELANSRNTTASRLVATSEANYTDHDLVTASNLPMPKGYPYYTINP